MIKKSILIVEDEILIAMQIKECICNHGYTCAGIAISYEDAIHMLDSKKVDMVLLDVTISGTKNGIDIAHKLNDLYNIPFIYLTSYTGAETIEKLKATKPKGYLSKPVNDASLTTMLDITFDALKNTVTTQNYYQITIAKNTYRINLEALLYVTTDHVYVELYYENAEKKLLRISLSQLLKKLPENTLIRINRGTAINPLKVDKRTSSRIFIGDEEFKISKLNIENINQYFLK